jgi:NAD(P)-dependent dehydrogenase (short-subunit alcohol dehydrogenase family)
MPTAFFTGGASWFCRETARLLLAEGWNVVMSDVNMKHLEEVVGELGAPSTLESCRLDVCDLQAVRARIDSVVDKYGSIDALVNVAGGTNHLGTERLPFHETSPEFWEKVIRPGLYGVMHTTHSVVPHMVSAGSGAIVSVASGMALRGQARMAVYSAVKHAVVGFSQAIAQEVAPFGGIALAARSESRSRRAGVAAWSPHERRRCRQCDPFSAFQQGQPYHWQLPGSFRRNASALIRSNSSAWPKKSERRHIVFTERSREAIHHPASKQGGQGARLIGSGDRKRFGDARISRA